MVTSGLFWITSQLNNLPFVSFQDQKKSKGISLTLCPSQHHQWPPPHPHRLSVKAQGRCFKLCVRLWQNRHSKPSGKHSHTLHKKEMFCFKALDDNFEVNEWLMHSLVQANTEHLLYIRVSLLLPHNENSAVHTIKLSPQYIYWARGHHNIL